MPKIDNDSQQSTERNAKTKQDIDEVLSKYKKNKNLAEKLNKYNTYLALSDLETIYEKKKRLEKEAEEAIHKQRLAMLADETKSYKEKMQAAVEEVDSKISSTLSTAGSTITKEIDNRLNEYIDKQTSIVAHLTGSNDSLDNVTSALTKLSGSGLVQQTAVYSNLSNLVKQGIVSNVEQKAFLQTLADDIDATFSASDGTLVRLINLQKEDLSANRLAIEYSLQEFLNQNYETSTYIQDAFQNVSKSLIEMQSLMTSSTAIKTEAVIQSYLGSMFSSGMSDSTISSLASAINALGSGDTSALGSGISNLILMAAAKAGLSYSDMITNGLDENSTESLLQAIASYMAELGGYGSNVVKSQLASAFGVTVSDLVAAQNFESSNPTGDVTSNIYDALLDNFHELVPMATQISNVMENFMNTMAMSIASDNDYYLDYLITNKVADVASELFGGTSIALKLFGSGVDLDVGKIANAAKIASLAPALLSGLSGLKFIHLTASGLYDALFNSKSIMKSTGTGFGTTGVSTSSSMYAGTTDVGDLLSGAKNSLSDYNVNEILSDEDSYNISDVFKLLDNGSLNTASSKHIESTSSSLSSFVSSWESWSDQDANYSEVAQGARTDAGSYLSELNATTSSIYELLSEKLDEIISGLDGVSSSVGNISGTGMWSNTSI